MDELVLKSFNGGGDNEHYLSIISPQDIPPKEGFENIHLYFYDKNKENVSGNICGGLLYLDDFNGKSVVCNLTTKEFKFLCPPKKASPCWDNFNGSGLGYDSESGDYKVIRSYTRCNCDPDDENDREGCRGGRHTKTELYSLQSDSWKEIPNPNSHIFPECGVSIMGNCYWTVVSHDGSTFSILSFNFSEESFSCIPSPPVTMKKFMYVVVECDGFLGAIVFERKSKRGVKSFQLWVWKESSWVKSFGVALRGIEKPLGLKDGRFLLLEKKRKRKSRKRKSGDDLSRPLVVYDCISKEWKEPDIYACAQDVKVLSYVQDRVLLVYNWITKKQRMKVLSYVEDKILLPDTKPMNRPQNVEDSSVREGAQKMPSIDIQPLKKMRISEMNLLPRNIDKVVVIGGGLMRSEIVALLVLGNYKVVLKEKKREHLLEGINKIRGA
ncbi:F-box/LRR-repeat/kelch-repeat protein At2g27520-like isoform X2 [Salvia miltiorrhiza]|uniref:F-box/LRR-repeat/kelch-repeat protein At2g27520-like isoform X2 n=1 Tax=Salvia miltiorrhiza TaxID=226208 RepID=UPI0025AD00FB|nr:F-box/LRR-repeat/kelch-repeat protein At2g27520-like isoform X2 [Salvia miltiorrhiza]